LKLRLHKVSNEKEGVNEGRLVGKIGSKLLGFKLSYDDNTV
jgi:hypothetical protein